MGRHKKIKEATVETITRRAPGITRMQNMKSIFSNGPYTFVREQYFADGVKSVTGYALKRAFILKDKLGKEVIVGKGEMVKHAKLNLPNGRLKKSKVDKSVFAEGKSSKDKKEEGDLDFIDE